MADQDARGTDQRPGGRPWRAGIQIARGGRGAHELIRGVAARLPDLRDDLPWVLTARALSGGGMLSRLVHQAPGEHLRLTANPRVRVVYAGAGPPTRPARLAEQAAQGRHELAVLPLLDMPSWDSAAIAGLDRLLLVVETEPVFMAAAFVRDVSAGLLGVGQPAAHLLLHHAGRTGTRLDYPLGEVADMASQLLGADTTVLGTGTGRRDRRRRQRTLDELAGWLAA